MVKWGESLDYSYLVSKKQLAFIKTKKYKKDYIWKDFVSFKWITLPTYDMRMKYKQEL